MSPSVCLSKQRKYRTTETIYNQIDTSESDLALVAAAAVRRLTRHTNKQANGRRLQVGGWIALLQWLRVTEKDGRIVTVVSRTAGI